MQVFLHTCVQRQYPQAENVENLSFLIVEDEYLIALHTEQVLTDLGQEVKGIALSGEEGIEMAEALRPDVIVMDIILNGELSGIEAAEEIQRRHGIPFIFLTGNLDKKHMVRIEKLDHYGFITKPADPGAFKLAVKLAVSKTGAGS